MRIVSHSFRLRREGKRWAACLLFAVCCSFFQGKPQGGAVPDARGGAARADGLGGPKVSLGERSLATLAALRDSRENLERELQELREQFEPNVGPDQRLEQLEAVKEIQQRIKKIEYDFETVATGIDVRAFDMGVEEKFDLASELENLLEPIISELRSATETPRELEQLRSALDAMESQAQLARAAIEQVTQLLDLARGSEPDAPLLEALEKSQAQWRERSQEIENQRTVARFQLEQRLLQETSVLDSAQTVLGEFFRTRGLNLLFALAVFFAILFGLRTTYRGVSSLLLRGRTARDRKFYARVIDVLYFGFSWVAALGGALLVLYAARDWAVLSLVVLVLMGLAWASKTAVPRFFEQIWLLLNLGTVREGERVVFKGLPWRVARLSLSVVLVNPELSGGHLRLPLRDMTGLRSRPRVGDELWFPTQGGDWILLEDGRLARVEHQSPEFVRIELEGGALVTFPTADFQSLRLERLSTGFRIEQHFGVDYQHRAICTDRIPQIMAERLIEGLRRILKPESLRGVQVEFLRAGASSLDYAVLADFEPDAAPRYKHLERALQRMLVDVCNAEGWTVPFTQITIHQAESAS